MRDDHDHTTPNKLASKFSGTITPSLRIAHVQGDTVAFRVTKGFQTSP
jgi:hypothetical protein